MKQLPTIDHIGIAVEDLDDAKYLYESLLGFQYIGTFTVPNQRVKVGILQAANIRIELLQAIDEDSVIHRFIQQKGPGIHHIALEVSDMQHTIKTLKEKNIELLEPVHAKGVNHSQIVFIHPKSMSGVLLELCQ
ncbi:methylmalonyl-CoA epimerase [Desulfuribacillus stibiiarsenatis]|uniref:Methylmalonyl-CoA epimerase n=1 Tax=Desulfuribacillus stibiiarsenatis TaxID=1390249 RepID=A0A1E5L6B9_9FIRM|nr:methylmalonyl-CoA epimerase [Desulfuribacillus stibiiarsenatis]OEH85685.1 methylmalonyl-CoA epimerase [Desulfuribacillus stibiiarsenatis]